ncbi:MAG: hypothetical protein IKL07_09615 [Clostridium sp.]|nr:hypothetical protein [Clostridium sp.]
MADTIYGCAVYIACICFHFSFVTKSIQLGLMLCAFLKNAQVITGNR